MGNQKETCLETETHNTVFQEPDSMQVFRFWKYKNRFRFHNLKSFHIEDYENLDFDKEFRPLTYPEQDEVLGDPDILKPVFFSTLFDSSRIVVTKRLGQYTGLNVITYNSKGKIVENEILAVQTFKYKFFEIYSKVINQNSLKRYCIDGVYKNKDSYSFDDSNIIRKDSMIERLTFLEEGKIRIDTLKRFKKNR